MAFFKIGPELSPAREAEQRQMLAQALLSQRKPVRYWSDGLVNAANMIAGTYLSRKAAASMDENKRRQQKMLADALKKAFGGGPATQSGAMAAMAGEPQAAMPEGDAPRNQTIPGPMTDQDSAMTNGQKGPFPPDGGVPAPAIKPVAGPFEADFPKALAGAEAKNELAAALARKKGIAALPQQASQPAMPQVTAGQRTVAPVPPVTSSVSPASPTQQPGDESNRMLSFAQALMQNPETFNQGYQLYLQAQQLMQQEAVARARQQQQIEAQKALEEEKFRRQLALEQFKAGQKQDVVIPGIGLYNKQTGRLISPYGDVSLDQGGADTPAPEATGAAAAVVDDRKAVPDVPGGAMPVPPGVSPKGAENLKIEAYKAGRKQIEKLAGDLNQMRDVMNMAQQFKELNKVQDTGGILLNTPVSRLGANIVGDKELSLMYSLTDKLTPLMRQGMPGSASNLDVAMFRSATISPEKPKEANDVIADGLIIAAKNKQGELEFKSAYLQKYGTLDGADSLWNKYLEDNSIFVKGPGGLPQLNPNRKDWREYFGGDLRRDGGSGQRDEGAASAPPPPPGFEVQ